MLELLAETIFDMLFRWTKDGIFWTQLVDLQEVSTEDREQRSSSSNERKKISQEANHF